MKDTILAPECAKSVSAPCSSDSGVKTRPLMSPASFVGTVKERRIDGIADGACSGVVGAVMLAIAEVFR